MLCKDQSRFSRDTMVIEQYLNDKFLEWDIRFIGVADNADTDSECYGTMRLFTSAYNEMYVKDISAKIRRTLAYKREQGQSHHVSYKNKVRVNKSQTKKTALANRRELFI